MEKLKVRGLIEKRQGANYYRVTEKGYIWINVAYSHNRYFLTPLLSESMQKDGSVDHEVLDNFEKAQNYIKEGLHTIYQELNLVA